MDLDLQTLDMDRINKTLEELEDDEFKKFQRHLRNPANLEGEEPLGRALLQNKDRMDTADAILQTYPDKVDKIMVNVLLKVGRKDLQKQYLSEDPTPSRFLNYVRDVLGLTDEDEESESKFIAVSAYDPEDHLRATLKSLQDNSNKCEEFQQAYKDIFQHNEKQVVTAENQIRAEIEKLHQFLREEEEKRVSALKQEEKEKAEIVTREMKNMQEQFSSLYDQISDIEQKLQKPNVTFTRDKYTLSAPQLVSEVLLDVDKHLGNLAYRVCEEIKQKVPFSPVILDPNTANCYLSLSEDLTSVRLTKKKQQLPNNPARFTMYPSVLGSEGFSSGTHTWEVEVGENPRWDIGYVRKSVDRKGERRPEPRNGIWCLRRHRSMEYSNGVEKISLQRNPQRIRVQLDYDMGKLSFYDTEDMTHICTYEGTFTEELYPYLNYEKVGDAETTDIRICQVAQGCPTCGSVSGSCHRKMALPKPSCSTQRDRKLKCVLQ